MTQTIAPSIDRRGHDGFARRYLRELSVAAAYALLLIALLVARPAFFQTQFRQTWISAAPLLVMAIGMTLVILARHIDISVGSQFSVCGIVAGLLATRGWPVPMVLLGTVAAGAVMGAVNGALVAGAGLPSIVVTLATMVILRGALTWATDGAAVTFPPGFQWFGRSQHGGQGAVVIAAFALLGAFAWAMRFLAAGRAVYAVGSDREAARLAGIRPRGVVFAVFVLAGALSGLAAMLNSVQFALVYPNAGEGMELAVIAAVVVGGTAISGGRGTLAGTLLGVALLATIGPALVFFGGRPYWSKAIQGAIILLAVASDALARRAEQMLPPPLPTGTDRRATLQPQQVILGVLLLIELLAFAATDLVQHNHFLSSDNFFEVLRLSVELGLLALAMTPVIVTGGIDLSVGSLLGLSAIVMGMLWRDAGLPLALAACAAIAFGALAGGLNALLITRLRIPPLIVTLGTYSLFRGVAEGITGGARNYTDFPDWFTFIGQGYLGPIPAQVPLFVLAAVGAWVLLHRSTVGRALSAVGYAPAGARYAGIPVGRRVGQVYVLSGLAAAVAAVVYTAHWGQAKADAGTGYELAAITAVVLGGTSIFGGRGSVAGTVLGLLAIAVLTNGLGLAAAPRELGAVLTGALLLIAIGLDRRGPAARPDPPRPAPEQELDMRNSQLAVLSAVILAAALIIAGGNFVLVNSIKADLQARGAPGTGVPATGASNNPGARPAPAAAKRLTIGLMPKSKGNAYFIAAHKGADDAAKELGVDLIWDGPTDPDPAKQNEIVETWITRGVDVIAVAVENRGGISSVLRKARAKGIKVITWDSDADPDARDFFVNQATPQGIGYTLMDDAAQVMGNEGEFAIITASLTAANMNEWQKHIKQRLAEKYPGITLATVEPCDDKQQVAFDKANAIMNSHPKVKLLMAICSPAVPGASEAVKQSGRSDVKVIGLGLPNDNKPYVKAGITPDVILWNTMDLGYLTVRAAHDVKAGTLKPAMTEMDGGRIGTVQLDGDSILLGKPVTFTKENIDQFDF